MKTLKNFGKWCVPLSILGDSKTVVQMPKFNKTVTRKNIIESILSYKKNLKWHQPWKNTVPENYVTSEKYKDFIYLSETKYWLTETQLKKLGGKLKKDAKGFYKGSVKLFNLADCTGLHIPKPTVDKKYNKCEKIIHNYLNNTSIELELDFQSTFYNRAFDIIRIPSVDCFDCQELYYSSLFHELIHSTAHRKRLNRFKTKLPKFGRAYEEEDLVAELGSCILCVITGISVYTFENQLSYLYYTLTNILSDNRIKNKEEYKKKVVENCYNKAQIAVDYLLQNKQ